MLVKYNKTSNTMKKPKRLGICMDNSDAHLMVFNTDIIELNTIESTFTHQVKEDTLQKSEHLMHNKEQQHQSAYYKELSEIIKEYDEVILFGPTNAKAELLNILSADHHFDNIKIEVEQTDKLTENQQHAYVKDYFSKNK